MDGIEVVERIALEDDSTTAPSDPDDTPTSSKASLGAKSSLGRKASLIAKSTSVAKVGGSEQSPVQTPLKGQRGVLSLGIDKVKVLIRAKQTANNVVLKAERKQPNHTPKHTSKYTPTRPLSNTATQAHKSTNIRKDTRPAGETHATKDTIAANADEDAVTSKEDAVTSKDTSRCRPSHAFAGPLLKSSPPPMEVPIPDFTRAS